MRRDAHPCASALVKHNITDRRGHLSLRGSQSATADSPLKDGAKQ